MARVKYIKTDKNQIIAFSHLLQHSDFKHFNPVSAGFICIGIQVGGRRGITCVCYGESISLDLKADEQIDAELAFKQILGMDFY